MNIIRAAVPAVFVLALTGCSDGEQSEALPSVQPVLSVVASAEAGGGAGFAGTIEPRTLASLAFRISGRVVARYVSVGDVVKKGTPLAKLDPVALELSVRSASAEAVVAEARLANARSSQQRIGKLERHDIASKAQLELAQEQLEVAEAGLAKARARLAKVEEQRGYAELEAEFDGVVTSVQTEVGQVVLAGQAILTIARSDMPEAVIDVPDQLARDFSMGGDFDIALEADRSVVASGRVREIAPQADPATRMRRIRIALDPPPARFRLGTIVTATPQALSAHIELPASGLVERGGKDMVWVVDPSSSKVFLRQVKVAARDGSSIRLAEGIADGTRVVVAGVHSLTSGQLVKITEE
jgi:RND family efflux transporter MFP subunit